MKIAIIGAGAIGGLVAGYLKLKNEDITLIGHPAAAEIIQKNGLEISGVRGNFNLELEVLDKLKVTPDLLILATKTQDIDQALRENKDFLKSSLILTTQNGVQADNLVAQYLPRENIISSIVMFGSTCLTPGKIVHNFEGSWILGKAFQENDATVTKISEILNKIFPAVITSDIKGMKYLKIFVNANNCIPAILGVSMQEAFSDLQVAGISVAIWKEGLEIASKAGIKLVSLPDFPLERLTKLTSLPTQEAAKIYSGIMMNLSKEPLYGSILQSIKRGKPSEIDYINGEFVSVARQTRIGSALNEKLVEMVHRVEKSKKFFSREELLSSTKGLCPAYAL